MLVGKYYMEESRSFEIFFYGNCEWTNHGQRAAYGDMINYDWSTQDEMSLDLSELRRTLKKEKRKRF